MKKIQCYSLYKLQLVIAVSILSICCSKEHSTSLDTSAKDSTGISDSTQQIVESKSDRFFLYEERQGQDVYIKYCVVCHGVEGKGDGFNAFNLDPRPRDFTDSTFLANHSDETIIRAITDGGTAVKKSQYMPSWGGTLSSEEIENVIAYIKMFSRSKEAKTPTN